MESYEPPSKEENTLSLFTTCCLITEDTLSDVTNQKHNNVEVQDDPPCRGTPVCGRNVGRTIIVEVMDAVEETTGVAVHHLPRAQYGAN